MLSKIFLMILTSFVLSFSQKLVEPAYGLWGFGITAIDRNYSATDIRYSPSPLIFGGYGPVWIEANRLGYTFFRSNSWFASVAAQIRSHQFRKEDPGITNRARAFEAGIQLGRHLWGNWVARLALLHDVSASHKSWEADMQFYTHFFPGPFRILAAAGVQYQGRGLTRYYYGTDTYRPQAAFVTELESILTLPIDKWGVFLGFRLWLLDKQAFLSPIARGNKISNLFTGIGYYF